MQISGHLSVQSSSTFRSRMADTPIELLRLKKIEQGQLLYPKICPHIFKAICLKGLLMLIGFSIASRYSRFHQTKPPPKQWTSNYGFGFFKGNWTSNASSGLHGVSYVSKYLHVKFQASQCKIAQSIAQMVNSRLCWVKSQLWSTYSQTSRFLVNINIFKSHSSFDQGLIMIHQENSKIHQKTKSF